MGDPTMDELQNANVAELIEKLRERSLFVSTIKANITHSVAFLIFHTGECPFVGLGVAIRGMSVFEGELLRSGPHRFRISEVIEQDTGKKQWSLQSEDNSFKVVAKEIWLRQAINEG